MNIRKIIPYLLVAPLFLPLSLQAEQLISRTYEFEQNQPKIIDNPLFWQLDTYCWIETHDAENQLTGIMKRKSGEINGRKLREGESTLVTVRDKDKLHIIAEVGAQVEITNLGKSTVIATCKL